MQCFSLYLAALALVMAAGLPTGRARRARLLVVVVVLAALQTIVVTAAIRWGEMRVPQVFGQRTLWTGVKEALSLGLLHAHFRVPHPSSYLWGTEVCASKVIKKTNRANSKRGIVFNTGLSPMDKLVHASTLHKHITPAVTKTSQKCTVTNRNTQGVCRCVCFFGGNVTWREEPEKRGHMGDQNRRFHKKPCNTVLLSRSNI